MGMRKGQKHSKKTIKLIKEKVRHANYMGWGKRLWTEEDKKKHSYIMKKWWKARKQCEY
jgi:hypothetical protein